MSLPLHKRLSIHEQVEIDLYGYAAPRPSSSQPLSSPAPPPKQPGPSTPAPASRRFWDVVMNPVEDVPKDGMTDDYAKNVSCGSRVDKGKQVVRAVSDEDEEFLSDSELLYPATPPPASSPPPSSPVASHFVLPSSSPLSTPVASQFVLPSPAAPRPPNSSTSSASSETLVASTGTSPVNGNTPGGVQVGKNSFVCNLNGCRQVLRREYWAVRAHVRYNPNHLGTVEQEMTKRSACPIPGCEFSNSGMMRVTEHICSKHLNVPVRCEAKLCYSEFECARTSALNRHRDEACKSCLACRILFDTAKERIQHEDGCPFFQETIENNQRKRNQMQQDEANRVLKKRRLRKIPRY